jgi:acetolactate synthase-1/2/3 large subunit
MASDNAIVTADVGQNQLWSARNFSFKKNRSYFTSGGLGTMGYSLPASIGAKLASPEKQVFCVVGDGGIQMLLGELGTLKEINEKIIIILFNNSRLGLVRELQLNAYGKGNYHGISFSNVPDFVKIANAYGIEGIRVTSNDEIENAVSTALESKESYLVEFVVDKDFATL